MFWIFALLLLGAAATTCDPAEAEPTVPCCSLEFGNTDGCLDVSREVCCLLNGTAMEKFGSKKCGALRSPCLRSCGNGTREPWEECDGGDNCTDDCRSTAGKCCAYPPQPSLGREECVPGETPKYWEKNESTPCLETPPDRAFCRRDNACCKCGAALGTKTVLGEIPFLVIMWLLLALVFFLIGAVLAWLFYHW